MNLLLVTLRCFSSLGDCKLEGIRQNHSKFSKILPDLNLGLAIDSRGKPPTKNEISKLSIALGCSIYCYHSSVPGKSSAQREFAIAHLDSSDCIILNDIDCSIHANDDLTYDLVKYDCVVFPVIFNSKFTSKNNAINARKNSFYFNFENTLRQLEYKKFGFCLTGSGQLLFIKARYLKTLPSDVGDDCYLPLKSLLNDGIQSYESYIYGSEQYSYTSPVLQFLARRRMILRNLPYTMKAFFLLLKSRKVIAACLLLIHKILRWLFISILLLALISLIVFLSFKSSTFLMASILFSVFICFSKNKYIFSALMGSLGVFLGVIEVILGKRQSFY